MCIAMARKRASHCLVGPLSFSNMYAYCIGPAAPGVFAPEVFGPEADAEGVSLPGVGAVPATEGPSAVAVAVATMAVQRTTSGAAV